jgi:hypothetical protein
MVDISIVDGGYKPTYIWGVPHCSGKTDLEIDDHWQFMSYNW